VCQGRWESEGAVWKSQGMRMSGKIPHLVWGVEWKRICLRCSGVANGYEVPSCQHYWEQSVQLDEALVGEDYGFRGGEKVWKDV
jgi:hypothetical protein